MTRRVVSFAITVAIATLLALVGGPAPVARAQPASLATKEASKHFQRGVALYGEADYRAALVEFRKAYEIAPNATVLYNIGQTYYQLQNYAAALTTLERYLTDAGTAASHRTEVEQTLEILQSRVGRIAITSNVSPCEIAIDDEHVGQTPVREPVLVSIGRRKVTAACDGRAAETRFVDIAAGDTVRVQFTLAESAVAIATPLPSKPVGKPANWAYRMWVVTGIVGIGAAVAGGLAYSASRDLKSARETRPVEAAQLDAKVKDLSDKSSSLQLRSRIADGLAVATVISGGLALWFTLSRSSSSEVNVMIAPNGIQIAGSFR